MADLKQSTTYNRMFLLVQSSDHITGLTGATPVVTISKNGGAFAAAGGAVTEVANGWYKIALTTTDTNTLGDLAFHITATGGDPRDFVDQVRSLLISDTLSVNVVQFGGVAGSFTTPGIPDVNVENFGGVAGTFTGGIPEVNVIQVGSVAQTGRDLGAGVLVSVGTGAGQIQVASGVVPSNMTQVNGHAVSDTTSGVMDVNAERIGGIAQTGGDLGVLQSSGAIDGYTLLQIMEMLAAVAFGKSSGLPTAPAFLAVNGSATRVAGTTDGRGNRLSTTLTP